MNSTQRVNLAHYLLHKAAFMGAASKIPSSGAGAVNVAGAPANPQGLASKLPGFLSKLPSSGYGLANVAGVPANTKLRGLDQMKSLAGALPSSGYGLANVAGVPANPTGSGLLKHLPPTGVAGMLMGK